MRISKIKTALSHIVFDSFVVIMYQCMGILSSIVDQPKQVTRSERNLYDTLP